MLDRTLHQRLSASDRRHQLLETALDLFSRKGFQGTTTKEIAAAAGVTEAIIFRHFPNKQELYDAVMDYKHECGEATSLFETWKTYMDRNDDIGLFRSMIHEILSGHRKDARFKRMLLFAALEGHETGLARHRERAMPIFEPIVQYVARRQREGAIRPGNPAAIIAAVTGVAANYGTLTEFFGFSVGITDLEATDSFLDIILHGVQPATTSEQATQ